MIVRRTTNTPHVRLPFMTAIIKALTTVMIVFIRFWQDTAQRKFIKQSGKEFSCQIGNKILFGQLENSELSNDGILGADFIKLFVPPIHSTS